MQPGTKAGHLWGKWSMGWISAPCLLLAVMTLAGWVGVGVGVGWMAGLEKSRPYLSCKRRRKVMGPPPVGLLGKGLLLLAGM
jgi:hypothetical protein